jgi:multicomponent Na+:H+ antiporter subunit G
MLESALAVAGTALLALGLLLATIGLYGLLRRPEIFLQLHASGLISGPASLLVLVASLATGRAEIITSALLIAAFVLVTAPLSSHAVGRAALRRSRTAHDAEEPTPAQADHH